MTQENELQRLEGFVSSLLEKFNALQEEKSELEERIQRREATIETLQEDLATMKNERGEISSRVGSLIDKIEEWEATSQITIKESDSSDSAEKDADSGVQGSLFSVNSQNGDTF
ncbi:MAG: hypothetical protein KKC77_12700 [Proteobacteria bacterium]|nr:hypothetical protein [Pseudomonadota bacterium]MBU1233741.1 hypothetical protein [Pseudomonadota bacterium]